MALKEYKPGTAFSGVIGRKFDVSQPAWPQPLRAKEGAPNVLFIVLDDVGFGQIGCFGGRKGKHQPGPLEIFIAAPDRNPTQTQSAGTCHFLEPAVHAGKLFFRGPEDHSPGLLVGIKDTHRR